MPKFFGLDLIRVPWCGGFLGFVATWFELVLLEIHFALFRTDLVRFGYVEEVGFVVADSRNCLGGRGQGGSRWVRMTQTGAF